MLCQNVYILSILANSKSILYTSRVNINVVSIAAQTMHWGLSSFESWVRSIEKVGQKLDHLKKHKKAHEG